MTQFNSNTVPAEGTKQTNKVFAGITRFLQSSIRNRLTVIVAGSAIIPVVLVSIILGWSTYVQVRNSLTEEAFNKLSAVQTIKANQITTYLAERQGDMDSLRETAATLREDAISKLTAVSTLKNNELTRTFLGWENDVRDVSTDPGVVLGMSNLGAGFQELGSNQVRALYLGKEDLQSAGADSYSFHHAEQHGFFTGYTAVHGYEDAFLIDPSGNVTYNVHKSESFGSNLNSDTYISSNLAALYQNLKNAQAGTIFITDIAVFDGKPAMFIGTPIYNGNTFTGILAYQLPLEQISAIMQERTGLGQTGETYLVGPDKLFRSASLFVEGNSILNPEYVVDTPAVNEGLAGRSGSAVYFGFRGVQVVAVYAPVNVPHLNWVLVSVVDAEEAFVPRLASEQDDFFTQYAENNGYYDIVLINPDGYVFYTVAKEKEYKTNILTGEYQDSNLGELVEEVLESKSFEFADFASYAPSDGAPAAFFAIPLLGTDQEVQMIVAAQASQEQLATIMAETTGLGASGETYILGQDLMRRTETRFLADLGAQSTILNPAFKVDTVASRSVVAGEAGQEIYTDARGIPVMAAWSPVSLTESDTSTPEAQVWGVIAKIDVSEALAPVNQLAGAIGLVIGLAVLVIGALAVAVGTRFAVGFVRPILTLTDTASQVAAGNMDLSVKTDSTDEIGTLSNAFNTMTSQLRDLIGSLEGRVAARTRDLATVAEVSTATATILETQKLLQAVVDLSKERFSLYHAHIYLLDEAGENLVLAAGAGEPGRIMAAEKRSIPLHREQSLVARAAREEKGIITNDVTQAPDFLPNPLLPDTRAELAVPMIVGGRVIGVFDVQSEQVGRFTDADISVKTTLASQIATSIQNVRTFEQSRMQAELESLVNAIGQKIQRSTTVEDTLQIAVREVGLALGASSVRARLEVARQDNGNGRNN